MTIDVNGTTHVTSRYGVKAKNESVDTTMREKKRKHVLLRVGKIATKITTTHTIPKYNTKLQNEGTTHNQEGKKKSIVKRCCLQQRHKC
jgi:hypothetical protein